MMLTVVRIAVLRLLNNWMELVLLFVVPVLFFSIFALIFGRGLSTGEARAVSVVIVDEGGSQTNLEVVRNLASAGALEIVNKRDAEGRFEGMDQEAAKGLIQEGKATLAICLPEGLLDGEKGVAPVRLLADMSNEIAPQVVSAIVSQVVSAERAHRLMEQRGAGAEGVRLGKAAIAAVGEVVERSALGGVSETESESESDGAAFAVYPVVVEDALGAKKANPRISMYAAGIAVMFLLFSASGAGGALLEEEESGALERLLTSQLGMTSLLAGKWLYIVMVGVLQTSLMFVWAQAVFGVDLLGHLGGFLVMTVSTAGAAASLALFLAAACRSRSQLNAVSIVLILSMSALGGSMIPRYLMSEEMQRIGLVTFNAWALDGYNKVFWRDMATWELGPQVACLAGTAVVLGVMARLLARRWEC